MKFSVFFCFTQQAQEFIWLGAGDALKDILHLFLHSSGYHEFDDLQLMGFLEERQRKC